MMVQMIYEATNSHINNSESFNHSAEKAAAATAISAMDAANTTMTTTTDDQQIHDESNFNATDDELATFMRLPQRPPVDIQFEDIRYKASLGFRKGEKEILHEINGRLLPGQLIAIMGPSGAGKSTLLDVLSGYRIKGVDGLVYTNGIKRNLKAFRKSSCYITQDDRLQPLLTVMENMKIAADFKLSSNIPKNEKKLIINEILENLNLHEHRNTRTSSLSGGQKKRLSIALELINNPLVMFLDEPTTGLDSSSCTTVVKLLKNLAKQGRTIVCTIHQPSASLFELFDLVYVLAAGRCIYQGTAEKLVPFLQDCNFPCPMYHSPADYVIELACGEHGTDKIETMVYYTGNGKNLAYFEKPDSIPNWGIKCETNTDNNAIENDEEDGLQETSAFNQLKVLMRRGYIKTMRDKTLTYTRIVVNISVGLMLGTLYWQAGSDGFKVINNYNLLFSILMHHMMSTMMLTILTFPSELSILIKEHFNRWYSLKMYYLSVTLIDIPVSVLCCGLFTIIIYYTTGQPLETSRLAMFLTISLLVVFVAQSIGLVVGSVFDVVNGTFLGPVISIPMMMLAGFGVTLRDLPSYLYWGSYISYLRYGLEGIVDAIYGLNRQTLDCPEDKYCHYKYPKKLLADIAMETGQFPKDCFALCVILLVLRVAAYFLLRYKLMAVR